ncbi:hypothetical protein [Methylobacterium sp. WL6]|uniref:hypothetical protein n=1 Tax=Methylobacterium sp. WL6 TaxID=2603901 RepID=UPI0011C9544F|nr:hypothetical protein [Methylobacterium sp. WL6]
MPRPEASTFRQRAWPATPAPRGLLALGTVLAIAAAGLVVARPGDDDRSRSGAGDPRHGRDQGRLRRDGARRVLVAPRAAGLGLAGGAYVAGPALMAGGALALWSLQSVGVAALGLHLGLFGVLAAGLTDPAFFDGRLRRRA